MLGAIVMYVMMAVTPRLSKRIFLPPVFYLLFSSLTSGMPLPIYFGWQTSLSIISGLQLCIGLLTLAQIRYLTPARRWLLTDAVFRGPSFRWANTLGFIGVNIALILPGTILYFILCLSLAVSHLTAGFLHLKPGGLEAEAREYVRGSKTVHLVPMVHIGKKTFYTDIGQTYTGRQTVVIMEGVTDTNGCLQSFRNIHQKLASNLGLDAQQANLFTNQAAIHYADVDASAFSPETLRMMNAFGTVLKARTKPEALAALVRCNTEFNNDLIATLKHDLFDERNRHCVVAMKAALAEYDCLVVPWGAAHMPYFEQFLLDRGFELSKITRRMVVHFSRQTDSPHPAVTMPSLNPSRQSL